MGLSLLAANAVDALVLTDIPDMLRHLQLNLQHNSRVVNGMRAAVAPLRWSNAGDVAALAPHRPPFDLIVGADLVGSWLSSCTRARFYCLRA